MKKTWHKTQFTGIEFYRHETRRHGVKYDCYYRGRFAYRAKTYISGFGWASEGWTPSKAFNKLQEYRNNAKSGQGPTTLKEEQEEREAERARQAEAERIKTRENITFSEFFETVYTPIAKQNVKKKTLNTQMGHYRYWLKPVVGKLTFKEITPFHLEKIKKNMLKAGRTPRTLQNCFATFRQTWNLARLQDLVSRDTPTRKVRIPRFDNKRVRYLSHEETDQLLEALKKHSLQTYDIALLSLHTGLRAGEIFHLDWSDIDLGAGTIFVRDPKNSKDRFAYLTEAAGNMLRNRYSGQAPNEPVFKDTKGKRVKEISNIFGKVVKELGLNESINDRRQRICFHSLRHTYASWLVQAGTDLYTVKSLLGHSSIQLTERYSHLRQEGLQQAVKEFDRLLKGADIISIQERQYK